MLIGRTRRSTGKRALLRAVVLLATGFPGEPEARLRDLIRRHIQDAVTQEWPAMAPSECHADDRPGATRRGARAGPSLSPRSDGQVAAQRELVASLRNRLRRGASASF